MVCYHVSRDFGGGQSVVTSYVAHASGRDPWQRGVRSRKAKLLIGLRIFLQSCFGLLGSRVPLFYSFPHFWEVRPC